MSASVQQALLGSVVTLLRPLVRLLLRYGIPFGSFAEAIKQVYVQVADVEFALPGRKQTNTRIAVLTGLTRKEVLRIKRLVPDKQNVLLDERYGRATRVISGWLNDPEFNDANGEAAALPLDGETGSFASLVARFSGDMSVRAVVDELLRVGAVRERADGLLSLVNAAYVPSAGEEDKLAILGTDVADLIATIDYNVNPEIPGTRFQLKVSEESLSPETVAAFREMSNHHSMALLNNYDKWLAERIRADGPAASEKRKVRAGVGIYYFEQETTPGKGD